MCYYTLLAKGYLRIGIDTSISYFLYYINFSVLVRRIKGLPSIGVAGTNIDDFVYPPEYAVSERLI